MTVTRLLDVTRLVSRAGLVQTGVDRVEFAYLKRIAQEPGAFGLARTALGFVVLDRFGLEALIAANETGDWGPVDFLSRLNRRLTRAAKRGQSLVRRNAVARCRPKGLQQTLRRVLPREFAYFNVGHSNLTQRVLQGVDGAGGKSAVLIHDTIPLDWPDMQRKGVAQAFARKLALVEAHAQLLICSTHAVVSDLRRHMNPLPQHVVAPLGVKTAKAEPIPSALKIKKPYFVSLGTIEPRKNHALLLDLWDNWEDPPQLFICGRRGWRNDEVFSRLDAGVAGVTEVPGLNDGQMVSLLQGASALLFPSFAEGYGLPPIEALALGIPVIVSDLPACREVLGDGAVYLNPMDRYGWEKVLKNMNLAHPIDTRTPRAAPDWDTHFKLVFTDGW